MSLSPVGFGAHLIHIWRGVPRVEPSSVTRVVPGRYGFRYGEGALTVL